MTIDHRDTAAEVPVISGWDYEDNPRLRAHHHDEWDRLRNEHPVFGTDKHPERMVWMLLGYDDIHAAMQSPKLFSSRQVSPFRDEDHQWIPEELDPPEHTKYRQLLNPYFSPGPTRALEPAIRQYCVELIDEITATEGCDLMVDFARRFPTVIFMRILGLPVEQADTLLEWVIGLMHTLPADDPDGSIRGGHMTTIYTYLTDLFEQRRKEPKDDLVSKLLEDQIDGRPLTDEELGEIGFLLYMAGLDTVAGMLGYTFKHLAEHPELQQLVRDKPARIPDVVEELLRYYGIVTTGRVVTEDTEFAGCPMKAGDRIATPFASANRDGGEFPDADKFIVGRPSNRHLAFGAGPHRCLGSNLARLELRVAIEEWHKRVPTYRVKEGAELTQHIGGVAGLDRLPLTWANSTQ